MIADMADPTEVVRTWLQTTTWTESFDVLAAHREELVSQAGLDALLQVASEEARSVHSAILHAIAGGFEPDFVRLLVTNRDAAREVVHQALRNGDAPVVRVVLALNVPLGVSDEGAAMFLATEPEDAVAISQAAAQAEPEAAKRVADQLEQLASQNLAGELAEVRAALRS